MSGGSSSFGSSAEHNIVGPDYFGFYTQELVELLSQDDDHLPFLSQTHTLIGGVSGVDSDSSLTKNDGPTEDNCSNNVFSCSIGADISDLKKERLRSLVRQSLFTFTKEVDEMLHPILSVCRMKSLLRAKKDNLSLHSTAHSSDLVHHPQKKQKVSSSSTNDDLQFLLGSDSLMVEKYVKKSSDELLDTIGYMEKKLEEFIDIVMSKCRSMTLFEKQRLRSLIQDLPPRNLGRVVEIIARNKPVNRYPCQEIYVDLENENKVTLWRLYYYVEAVENARRLLCVENAGRLCKA